MQTNRNKYLASSASAGRLHALRGEMVTFHEDPFLVEDESRCYSHFLDGLVVIQGDRILAAGPYADVAPIYPELTDIEQYPDSVIIPGMIDCHVHYVQSPMIGSFGDTLLQ